MEKITIFLFLFICLFLIYSYIKFKNEMEKNEKKEEINSSVFKPKENLDIHVIAAVIAAVMDGKKYKIRKIFLEKKENKNSAWRISGRDYNMQRRDRI